MDNLLGMLIYFSLSWLMINKSNIKVKLKNYIFREDIIQKF